MAGLARLIAKKIRNDPTPEIKRLTKYQNCALKQASIEITGAFDNDNEAMTEARATITEAIPKGRSYSSRLTDFNNDPATTFAELQKYLVLVEERLTKRMAEERAAH